MGEFSITFAIQIPGESRHRRIDIQRCANLNCKNGPDGDREIVLVEVGESKKFCGKSCRVKWNNKRGKKRQIGQVTK